jgi:hypothetical protein
LASAESEETLVPETKAKTEAQKNAPTEAQLATLAGLVDELGIEAPVVVTADEAQSAIEDLRKISAESEGEPEPEPGPDPEEEAEEEQLAAEEAQARSGAERSDKQTQQMFDRAMRTFHDTLCVVFEVADVSPASAPGVVGFLLPGFTEQKTHADFTRCQTCNGYGSVLTGSSKAGEETRPCPDGRCKGRGYWERATAPPPQPMPVSPVTGPTAFTGQPVENGSQEWGEAPAWMGDPRLNTGGQ